jgi:hypothetical protein
MIAILKKRLQQQCMDLPQFLYTQKMDRSSCAIIDNLPYTALLQQLDLFLISLIA